VPPIRSCNGGACQSSLICSRKCTDDCALREHNQGRGVGAQFGAGQRGHKKITRTVISVTLTPNSLP